MYGRFTREIQRLKNDSPLEDFFGINQDKNSTLTIEFIDIGKNNKYGIILDIEYRKKNNYFSFHQLPPEINNLIDSFNFYSINIKCILQFPEDYPFNPIKWGLLSIKNNINKKCLNEYYKTIIREHNEEGFSPASTIHKNILSYIVKINNFETIINCT